MKFFFSFIEESVLEKTIVQPIIISSYNNTIITDFIAMTIAEKYPLKGESNFVLLLKTSGRKY